MAGTVTITEQTISSIKKITFTWLSSAGGAADGTTTLPYDGVVASAEFVPDAGGTQPDDLYDVVITKPNGVDVLGGYGANLTNAATVNTLSTALAGGVGIGVVGGEKLTLGVTNAGAANGGTVYLYIG